MSVLSEFIIFENMGVYEAPILIACPHSGRNYPDELQKNLLIPLSQVREMEDFYVDEICKNAPNFGFGFIYSTIARAYIDLNRGADSLDKNLIDGVVGKIDCQYANSGIGLIPRIVNRNQNIFKNRFKIDDINSRIENIHKPYHNAIKGHLDILQQKFGKCLLVDMHSMPNRAVLPNQCDIVIGNAYSKSASSKTTNFFQEFFERHNLKVKINQPFSGGYTTKHHANLHNKREAIQIEINRKLYFDEQLQIKSKDFDSFSKIIGDLFKGLSEFYK
jgi:N-formylglutamate amidohydrolase